MFFFTTDLLYWQPQEDQIPFALEQTSGKVKNAELTWGWGFRIALDYGLARDSWDLHLRWTCLPIQKDTEASGHLLPYWTTAPMSAGDFVSHAKAHWRLHLGIVDLELSRDWVVSSKFNLVPRLGVRFASIRQKYYVTYKDGSLFPGEEDHFNSKNKFWGVGPEGGFNATWYLSENWSLFSSFSISLVYGQIYVHESDTTSPSHVHHLKLFNIFPYSCLLWDMSLGIEWIRDNYTIHAAWEQHLFPGQNQLTPFLSQTSKGVFASHLGDLSLVGVTFGATWKF